MICIYFFFLVTGLNILNYLGFIIKSSGHSGGSIGYFQNVETGETERSTNSSATPIIVLLQ